MYKLFIIIFLLPVILFGVSGNSDNFNTLNKLTSVTGTTVSISGSVSAESLTITNNIYGNIIPSNDTYLTNNNYIDSCAYADTYVEQDSFAINSDSYELQLGNFYITDTGTFANVLVNTDLFGCAVVDLSVTEDRYYVFGVSRNIDTSTLKLKARVK